MNTMIRFQRKPNKQILYIEYHYKESTDPAQYPGLGTVNYYIR
jgi:hypothetical protein